MASSSSEKVRVLLTGIPGVGKTTLAKKVCSVLAEKGISISGFYTEELRIDGKRAGFDVVTWCGDRQPLARRADLVPPATKRACPTVGQYCVDITSFELCAIKSVQDVHSDVILIDEIGKMELFSHKFQEVVRQLFKNHPKVILATVPVPRGKPLPLVEEVKRTSKSTTVNVTRENRDTMLDIIANQIIEAIP